MIKSIRLKNFKSHKNTLLECNPLTVLCGSNGVGKSSAIHALLLLRESYLKKSDFKYLDLKSNPVTIGTANDALYQFSEDSKIELEICTKDNKLLYCFEAKKDSDLEKTLIYKSPESEHISDKDTLEKINIFSKECQFISAARLGPQNSYVKDDVVVDEYNQISVIEGKAEHFVHFLNKKSKEIVLESLLSSNNESNDLFSQTSAWEKGISEGVNIVVEDKGNLGYELKYEFNTKSDAGKTNKFKAANVGFGLTYVMPIIVAILSAKKDTLLLIENPEAHLHPNGQARLAELICLASEAGIQIMIETHSDHIINGILVNCKRFDEKNKGINKENVSIYHFDRDETNHSSSAKKVKIEENGKIRYAPKGFFDQFTIDRKFLIGF